MKEGGIEERTDGKKKVKEGRKEEYKGMKEGREGR